MTHPLLEQLQALQDLRVGLALDITPAQVATVRRLERDHERATEHDPRSASYIQHPEFQVEITASGCVRVSYVDSECGYWECEVLPSGGVVYERF